MTCACGVTIVGKKVKTTVCKTHARAFVFRAIVEKVVNRELDLDEESRNYWTSELKHWKKLVETSEPLKP